MPLIFLLAFLFGAIGFPQDSKCPTGKHWVSAHYRQPYIRADGTSVSGANVSAHCRENPNGYDRWYSMFRAERPKGWPQPKEKTKAWTVEEIERVLELLGEIPEALWLDAITGIHRMEKSIYSENPGASHEGAIVVYDKAFTPKANLARVLSHEMAH